MAQRTAPFFCFLMVIEIICYNKITNWCSCLLLIEREKAMAIDNLLLEKLLELTPQDKLALVEALVSSLDNPDPAISPKWLQEADARLKAYRLGLTKGIPVEEIFFN